MTNVNMTRGNLEGFYLFIYFVLLVSFSFVCFVSNTDKLVFRTLKVGIGKRNSLAMVKP